MGNTPLRIAIVGCGGITALAHLPALCRMPKGNIEIAYLCDRDKRRASILAQRFNLERTSIVDDYERVLNDESVEAVILASWPSQHAEMATAFILANRHVLIQKPLLLPEESAKELEAATHHTRANVLALPLLSTVSTFRKLKSIIDAGVLGSIRFARIRTTIIGPDDYYRDVRDFFREKEDLELPYLKEGYANSAGCIGDMGPYALSAFHFLFGSGILRMAYKSQTAYDELTVLTLEIPWSERYQLSKGQPTLCSIEIGWKQVRDLGICSVFGSSGTACIEVYGATCDLGEGWESVCIRTKEQYTAYVANFPHRCARFVAHIHFVGEAS